MVQVLGLLCLVGWWGSLSPATRLLHLGAVMRGEHVVTVPPDGWVAQAVWLYGHRLQRLTGMVGLLVVAGVAGMGEGITRRRGDVLGGFRLTWWVTGRGGLALIPGAIAGYLLAPWPLAAQLVASGLALLLALVMYGLTAGRPYAI
jgi:hypothetical protein